MELLRYKYKVQLNNNLLQVRISKNMQNHRYGWDTLRHSNAEHELHIVLKGAVYVEVEDKRFCLDARQGIVIPAGLYHAPTSASEQLERFSISFFVQEGELKNDLAECKVFNVSTDMLQNCNEIYRECESSNAYRDKKVEALITSLVISVMRSLNLNLKQSKSYSWAELERTDIIDNFFDVDLKQNRGAADLAKQLHISERQLNRIIFKLYGMNFQNKLTQAKMDRAAWLLRTTDMGIDRVFENVGYSSEAAFYQAFKKYFNTTPKRYRDLMK